MKRKDFSFPLICDDTRMWSFIENKVEKMKKVSVTAANSTIF